MKLITLALLGSSIATSLVGCNRGDGELATAEGALDSSDSVEAEGNVMMAVIDGAEVTSLAPALPEDVAARIAANAATRWQPTGCATVTQNLATITIDYNSCSGPRGLIDVTGQLVLTVRVALDGTITVRGVASDLEVNDAVLSIDAEAVYSRSATGQSIAVSTRGSAIGPRGNELEHTGDYTITWDAATQCRTLAGDWSTTATRLSDGASATRRTSSAVERCVGSCPTGTLSRTFLGGTTVTVTFDGTSTASWSSSNGRTGSIALRCP